jgi:hypothetical protein
MSDETELNQAAKDVYESEAEKWVKRLAVLTLPLGEVYPATDKNKLPRPTFTTDANSDFEISSLGIGYFPYDQQREWPPLESTGNSGRKFKINDVHYGFNIVYFDPNYFDPDYFEDGFLSHNILFPSGIVLNKGNESYALPTPSFIFMLDEVARMEKHLAIADLPTGSFTEIFINSFLGELELILLGLHRSLEGWNFFDPDRQIEIAEENERMYALIISIFKNVKNFLYIFSSCLAISIVSYYILNLSEKEKKKILEFGGKIDKKDVVAKLIVKSRAKKLAKKLIENITLKISKTIVNTNTFKKLKIKPGTSGGKLHLTTILYLLTKAQGYLQKASISSRQLKSSNKYLYDILFNKNLDMAYWIVEPYLPKIKRELQSEIKQYINRNLGTKIN